MADAGVDIAALSEDQQLALQQFTAVTDSPIDKAVPLLQRCQWNVQIAIARFFDGEPTEDPVAAAGAEAAPQDVRRQETLMNGFTSSRSSTSSGRRVRIEPAPRVVPQPESQVSTQVPFVLAVIFAPFSLVYSLLGKWFKFMGWLFPFLPRTWGRVTASNINRPASQRSASGRRPLNPRDTAARFIREFEEEHGSNKLPFHEGGYASAFDLAKKDLKFLLVVLVSPEHDDTHTFLRTTLLNSDFVSFLRDPSNNMLLWAGNVQDAEAYQVASALSCTKFPFSGLIVHTPQVNSTAMGIATRIAGPTPPSQYLAKLKAAMQQHAEPLSRARAQRSEQAATRNIRAQQDSAYERSLAVDRERARKKKEDAERKAREEKQARELQEKAELQKRKAAQWRRWRAKRILPEPPAGDKDAVRISLRLLDAQRVVRRFKHDAPLEEVYAFVECYAVLFPPSSSSSSSDDDEDDDDANEKVDIDDEPEDFEHEYTFQLVSPMPREVFALDKGGEIRKRIGRSANLIVERLEGDGEDEEDGDEE